VTEKYVLNLPLGRGQGEEEEELIALVVV